MKGGRGQSEGVLTEWVMLFGKATHVVRTEQRRTSPIHSAFPLSHNHHSHPSDLYMLLPPPPHTHTARIAPT